MNSRRINYQEQIHQQSHGVVNDFDLDFTDCSNQFLVNTQHPPDQMGLGRLKSPTSALYSSQQFLGFDSRTCDSQLFPSYQSSSNFDARNTLQSIVKSHDLCTNQYLSKLPRIYDPHNKSLGNYNDVSVARYLLSSYIEEENQRVSTYSSPFAQLGQEKQSPRLSCGDDFSVAGSASTGAVASSKTRIRWTQELHEKFVECVNHLGGAEKATPKAVLKLMDSDGLTIFHVKSHLQKYRIAKYVPDKSEGRTDKRSTTNNLPQLDSKTGLQIKEALQLQLDVQRQLHEQLEIQRNLQLRIEEQGKQLRMMFDKQQQTNTSPEDAKVSVPEQASDDKTTFTSNLS